MLDPLGRIPAALALITNPPWFFFSSSSHACASHMCAMTLRSQQRFQSSSAIARRSLYGPNLVHPALETTKSMPPSCWTVAETRASTPACVKTSPWIATWPLPGSEARVSSARSGEDE